MYNKNLKTKIYHYFTTKWNLVYYRRGWLKGTCPYCGKIDKFGVNLSLNRTNCFVCGNHPSPLYALMDLEGLENRGDVRNFLKDYRDTGYIEPIIKPLKETNLQLPQGYKNLLFGKSLLARRARKYVESRGFNVKEKALKGWGYCNKGDHLGYIIIPFYVDDKLVYFNGRKYLGSGKKYRNPSVDESGLGKSFIWYNADSLGLYDEVSIVEGAINAETLGDQGIAAGGKKISNYQISMLLNSKVKKVNILLDPDALLDAARLAFKIVGHKKVRIVTWEYKDKDVNDLGQEKTLKYIKETKWMSYQDIIKFKNGEESKLTYLQKGFI